MPDNETDDPNANITERTVDTDDGEPSYHVLESIATVEGVDVTELPPVYERIGHILDGVFDDPPIDEAQVEVTFSYHGYRVTVNQNGTVTLRKLDTTGAV